MNNSKAKEIRKICIEFGLNKRQYKDYKKIYKSLPQWKRSSYLEQLRQVLTELRDQYGKI
tara:strand:- start:3958 stop:4137 length:180 start_codon:yes stop_codon:yes gene_type:complete